MISRTVDPLQNTEYEQFVTKITINTRLVKIINEGYPANVFLLQCCWTALERAPIKDSTGVLFIMVESVFVCVCVQCWCSGVHIDEIQYLLDCTRKGTSLGLVYTADAGMYWCTVGLHSKGHLSKISVQCTLYNIGARIY